MIKRIRRRPSPTFTSGRSIVPTREQVDKMRQWLTRDFKKRKPLHPDVIDYMLESYYDWMGW